LNSPELAKFQVLILPEGGNYAGVLGDAGIQRVKNWVQSGGTIIALGAAVGFLADTRVGLLDIAQEDALRESESKEKPAEKPAEKTPAGRVAGTALTSEADFDKAIRATSELPDSAPGAIVRARVRQDFWLTAGLGDAVNVMAEGRAIFTPVKTDKGVNAAYFESAERLIASGHLWSENRKQMAFKPLVVTSRAGRGVVVGFTADPNFRAMLDGMNLMFLNAVFRGPAHAAQGQGPSSFE
jgi:hypothetical protein